MQRNIQMMLAVAALTLLAACGRAPQAAEAQATQPDDELLARGRYLVVTSGCNDCHSPGFAESGGQTPPSQWLLGTPVGYSGPWGTTYPANLRQIVQGMDEAGWLAYTTALHTRPPMPDFAVRAMTEEDRRALYRFIRSLGPGGQAAPAYLPPGQEPPMPYVKWMLPAPPAQEPAAG